MKIHSRLSCLAWLSAFCMFANGAAPPLAQSPDPDTTTAPAAVVAGGLVFMADGDASDWSGRLRAWKLDSGTARMGAPPEWDSAGRLDAPAFDPATRVVVSHDASAGIAFRWNMLQKKQQTALAGTDGAAAGRLRLDYIRGDHRSEQHLGGTLRSRLHTGGGALFRQGDIVHSRPWWVGKPVNPAMWPALGSRPAMVYVGGNDGFLHGFEAITGTERLAYLPRGAYAGLREFTQPGAGHRYLVDGSSFSGDADIHATAGSAQWATLLVGSPGAGAPGYFVLDISRPSEFSESGAGAIVLMDRTDGTDADIGHITADPATDAAGNRSTQIVQLNDERWAAVMGNGANSRNEMPVLLVQYLDGARELLKISPACAKAPAACAVRGGNGLATPLLIDTGGDGLVDLAYAGDLLGNVWKFDLGSNRASDWRVDLKGSPLFTARDAAGNTQAITSAPGWLPHPQGGLMLAVGTGRDLTVADRADQQVQTLYGLHDNGQAIAPGIGNKRPATLVVQTLLPGTRTVDGHDYERGSALPVDYRSTPAPRGWLLDLPVPGERVLHSPRPFGGQKMMFFSSAAGRGFVTVLNLFSGRPAFRPAFMALADPAGTFAPAENAVRVSLGPEPFFMVDVGSQWRLVPPTTGAPPLAFSKGTGRGLRAGWRQLQ